MTDAARNHQVGFSLIDILAALLVLTLGMAAAVALVLHAVRLASATIAQDTAIMTAVTTLYDHCPGGLTDDLGDADSDGWSRDSATTITASGAYDVHWSGVVNGYYVRRRELSEIQDVISASQRQAAVSVDVFFARDGAYVTTIKRRILRSATGP